MKGIPTFPEFLKQNFPDDIPDDVRRAASRKYFYRFVAPELLKKGVMPAIEEKRWLEKTERKDKSSFPGLGLAMGHAVEAAASPFKSILPEKQWEAIASTKREAVEEAQKQKISPLKSLGAEVLGRAWGESYLFPAASAGTIGLKGVGAAMKMSPKIAEGVAASLAWGGVQGAYEAASAEEGGRLSAAASGAVLVGGGMAGFQFAPPLVKKLMQKGFKKKVAERVADDIAKEAPSDFVKSHMWRLGPEDFQKRVSSALGELRQEAQDMPKSTMLVPGAQFQATRDAIVAPNKQILNQHLKGLEARVTSKAEQWEMIRPLGGNRYRIMTTDMQNKALSASEAMKYLEKQTDGIEVRQAQRILRHHIRRSGRGSLAQLEKDAKQAGWRFQHSTDDYAFRNANNPTETRHFKTLEEAADWADQHLDEPLTVPELGGRTWRDFTPHEVKEALAEFLCSCDNPPSYNLPRGAQLKPVGGKIPMGFHVLGLKFRPFLSAITDISEKFKWPELRSVVKNVLDRDEFATREAAKYLDVFEDIVKPVSERRLKDMYKYMSAGNKPEVMERLRGELKFTDEEFRIMNQVKEKVTDPLYSIFGIKAPYQSIYAHKIRSRTPEDIIPGTAAWKRLSKEERFYADMTRTGDWNPDEAISLRDSMNVYVTRGFKFRYLQDDVDGTAPLKRLRELIDRPAEGDTGAMTGAIQEPLRRFELFMRNKNINETDETIYNFFVGVRDNFNKVRMRANRFLPKEYQFEPIMLPGRDIMSKWQTYQYASLPRPMSVMRDIGNIFITGFPVIGSQVFRGMDIAMKKGAKNMWQEADQAGALLKRRHMYEYLSNAGVRSQGGRVVDALTASLGLGDNIARVAVYTGSKDAAKRTWKKFLSTKNFDDYIDKTGLWAADAPTKAEFLAEARRLAVEGTEETVELFFRKTAKEVVELTNWRIRKGQQPGLYFSAAGRLFGMYGTWPMNYIEFMRRLGTNGTRRQRMRAAARLSGAHYSLLATGDAAGIDAGNMVFAQPGAFGGGPVLDIATAGPEALFDWYTVGGEEARSEIGRLIPLQFPTGLTLYNLFQSVKEEDNKDAIIRILGFHPAPEDPRGYRHFMPTPFELKPRR